IAANELPPKHYDETINSSRAYRLDHDTNGIVSLRVIIQPPKPRENKKKPKTEPRWDGIRRMSKITASNGSKQILDKSYY
ncbi:unnamed protein product, partial [Didymodactylos carnosus]